MQSLEVHTHLIFTQIIKCQTGQILIHHTVSLLCSITRPIKDWQCFAFPSFFHFSFATSDRLWGGGGKKERKKEWGGMVAMTFWREKFTKGRKGWTHFEKSGAPRNHLTFPFRSQDAANVIKSHLPKGRLCKIWRQAPEQKLARHFGKAIDQSWWHFHDDLPMEKHIPGDN